MSRTCINCGQVNTDWAELCGRCGASDYQDNPKVPTLVSPNAITGEAVVGKRGRINDRQGMAYILLPKHLIGKRVKYTLEVVE